MKRTRSIQTRFMLAREETENIVRCNAGIKGADAYRLLKLWHEEKIANCLNEHVIFTSNCLKEHAIVYSIPSREHFYKWYKLAIKNADLNYELKRMIKHGKRNTEIRLDNNRIVITIDLGDE